MFESLHTMKTVTVFSRPGCCLCDEVLARLEELNRPQRFRLEVVDIESDDTMFKAYLERIPVVAVDGTVIC